MPVCSKARGPTSSSTAASRRRPRRALPGREDMPALLALVFAVALLSGPALSAAADKWNMASGYPEPNHHTQDIRMFIVEVQKGTGNQVDVVLNSNLGR